MREDTARRALLVAFHFPPVRGSSGLQRTLSFARYLPRDGWCPLVLSASPRAYPDVGEDQLRDIGEELVVRRAFALDTARHLAIAGRYPGLLALPDRWVTWCLGAVPAGLWMCLRHRPAVLWSTYPIATAHLVGLVLHRLTGLPWVADFRDSMTEASYPRERRTWRAFRAIERATLHRCSRAVFTAPQAREMYARRYPDVPEERLVVLENGYDEQAFEGLEASPPPLEGPPVKILHSGILYPNERDPSALFDAIARLHDGGRLGSADLQMVLRASGYDERYRAQLDERGIAGMVRLEPSLPYREALAEMLAADALLIMQARSCNHQIPAKLYEYFRARRPILALTDAGGDTAGVLRAAGVEDIAEMTDASAIARALERLVDAIRAGSATGASEAAVTGARRSARTRELAALFETVTRSS